MKERVIKTKDSIELKSGKEEETNQEN